MSAPAINHLEQHFITAWHQHIQWPCAGVYQEIFSY